MRRPPETWNTIPKRTLSCPSYTSSSPRLLRCHAVPGDTRSVSCYQSVGEWSFHRRPILLSILLSTEQYTEQYILSWEHCSCYIAYISPAQLIANRLLSITGLCELQTKFIFRWCSVAFSGWRWQLFTSKRRKLVQFLCWLFDTRI